MESYWVQTYDPFTIADFYRIEDVGVCQDSGYAVNGFYDFDDGMGYEERWGFLMKTDNSIVSSDDNIISINQNNLNAYPNPFNGEVSIEYSMNCSNNNLEIYNIKGQRVYSETNIPTLGTVLWNCEAQTSGIYLVKISNSKQKYVKKITYLK